MPRRCRRPYKEALELTAKNERQEGRVVWLTLGGYTCSNEKGGADGGAQAG